MAASKDVDKLISLCQQLFDSYAKEPACYRHAHHIRSIEGDFNIWWSIVDSKGPEALGNIAANDEVIALLGELSVLLEDREDFLGEKLQIFFIYATSNILWQTKSTKVSP